MPVLAPPDAAPVEVAAPPAAAPPPAAEEPSPAPVGLPPAPPAPPGTTLQPPSPNAPAPAKTDHLAERAPERVAEDELDDVEQSRPQRHWYGWQTLVADGASFATLIAAASVDSQDHGRDSPASTLAWLGVLSYELTPGIIHFVHRNPGRGFASFGLRLGMPIAGAFIGASAASGCNGFLCEAGGAAIGVLAGMGGAIAIDAAVFAYDDPKPSRFGQLTLSPVVAVLPGRAWVGLSGRL
jgi:hypothetical protein